MSSPVTTFETGTELPAQTYTVTRADLVRYAGASGDRNPIHWSDRVATSVGLPGVIAHGMYTLALAARALDTWAGGPGRVRELGCKFTKPVVVPDDEDGVEVVVRGTVKNVTDEGVQIALEVTCGDQKVLGMPKAVLGV
jgi:acyl dehydratase